MDKRLVMVLLMCAIAYVASKDDNCDVAVKETFKQKMIKKIVNWWKKLIAFVAKDATEPECNNCSSIRPNNETDIPVKKDPILGCSCEFSTAKGVGQCFCCVRINKWNLVICTGAGLSYTKSNVFVFVAVEDYQIFKYSMDLDKDNRIFQMLSKAFACVPLPFPIAFISVCFKPSFEFPSYKNNHFWRICGAIQIGLFQVPVLSMVTACFGIDNYGNMSLDYKFFTLFAARAMQDGSELTLPDSEIPPARVLNNETYNSVVCLTNAKKNEAKKMKLMGIRQEVKNVVETKINWDLLKIGEVPYLAVLHQRVDVIPLKHVKELDALTYLKQNMIKTESDGSWMDIDDNDNEHDQLGTYCGGALLTPNKVLTNCGCIRTFYMVSKLSRETEDVIFPYDMQSHEIFVDVIPGATYSASRAHRLNDEPDKFMSDSLCAKHIANNDTWLLQTMMIVMEFTPDIKNPVPGQFVHWPPQKVKHGHSYTMAGLGLEPRDLSWVFKNSSGSDIDFDEDFVKFYFKQCDLTSYDVSEIQKDERTLEFGDRLSGFCAAAPKWQLCYGAIGFPIMDEGGGLVGLSALPINCDQEGSIAGTIFDQRAIAEVDKFVNNRNSRAIYLNKELLLIFLLPLLTLSFDL